MAEQDFIQIEIPAGDWGALDDIAKAFGGEAQMHWLPVSNRARSWFAISAYKPRDKKLQDALQIAFGTKQLELSIIDQDFKEEFQIGSRCKEVTQLTTSLIAMEKVFIWGYQKGLFKGIMHDNPEPKDFWTLLRSIAREDPKTSQYYLRKFTLAYNEVIRNLMATLKP
jgi:hypothetical protein